MFSKILHFLSQIETQSQNMIMATHKESFVVRNLAPVLILQTIPLAGEAPFFPFFAYNRAGEIQSMLPSFILFASFFLQGQPNGNTLTQTLLSGFCTS